MVRGRKDMVRQLREKTSSGEAGTYDMMMKMTRWNVKMESYGGGLMLQKGHGSEDQNVGSCGP